MNLLGGFTSHTSKRLGQACLRCFCFIEPITYSFSQQARTHRFVFIGTNRQARKISLCFRVIQIFQGISIQIRYQILPNKYWTDWRLGSYSFSPAMRRHKNTARRLTTQGAPHCPIKLSIALDPKDVPTSSWLRLIDHQSMQ